ncbi:TPA: hypothetical protein SML79_000310 [Serratia marcescens]|nr:hypothetical protein [Serratia marcescens]
MIIRQADVIESIHTGNTFVVEYVSEDGNFFILHPKDGEKSRGYNIHELNRSFVKVPHVPLANEGDMIQPQIEPQNIPNNIPGDLAAAVNRLLDCDGTRGHFSAIRCSDAREEVERLLAQPVSCSYKLPPHVYRELVNSLRDTAVKFSGTEQLRERLNTALSQFIEPDHPHTRTVALEGGNG